MLTSQALEGLLFALFATLTAILDQVLVPTYDNLLVPMLTPGALYPSIDGGGGSFFGSSTGFSGYLVLHLVDPAIPLVALALGVIYLARAVLPSLARRTEGLVPRLVVAVVLANFSVPVASAILGIAATGYPAISGFDGGAWRDWNALAGPGLVVYSWDNGALAFVLTFVLFSLVLLLVAAVAVRDALLAVLVVLLPLFTLVSPIPPLAPLARRGWLLFGELAFLPWVVVVPLELAVGAPSAPLLVGFLTVALAAPGLLAITGGSLSALGLPSAGNALSYGLQRGLSLGSAGAGGLVAPGSGRATPTAAQAVKGAARAAVAAPLPATLPLFAGHLTGHAAARLFGHIPRLAASSTGGRPVFPAVHPPGPGGRRP